MLQSGRFARGSVGALDAFATLSTAANSEVNNEATTKIGISSGFP